MNDIITNFDNYRWYFTWYPGCQKAYAKIVVPYEVAMQFRSSPYLRDQGDGSLFGDLAETSADFVVREGLRRLGYGIDSYAVGGNTKNGYKRHPKWVDEDGTILVRTMAPDGTYRCDHFEAWYYFPVVLNDTTLDYSDEDREFQWEDVATWKA